MVFPAPGGPTSRRLWAPAAAISSALLPVPWRALRRGRPRRPVRRRQLSWRRCVRQIGPSLRERERLRQRSRRARLDPLDDGCLGRHAGRADHTDEAGPAGGQGDGQDPRHAPESAVERQLGDPEVTLESRAIPRLLRGGRQHTERRREVEAGAGLGQVGWRMFTVIRLGGNSKAAVEDRGAHLSALSRTAESGSPKVRVPGSPVEASTWTSTIRASIR